MKEVNTTTKPFLVGKFEGNKGAKDNFGAVYLDFNVVKALGLSVTELKGMNYGRSAISLDKLLDRLALYERKDLVYDGRVLNEAIKRAYAAFKLDKPIQAVSFEEIPYENQASAGFGYEGKKVDNDNFTKAKNIANGILSKKSVCTTPCVAYARGHFSHSDNPKTRLVWGFPFHQTLIEGRYAAPLIEAYMFENHHPMVIGHSSSYVAGKMNQARSNGFVQATDFSAFDSSIQGFLIKNAFKILFQNFLEVKRCDLKAIVEYFINTPIQFANGERYVKKTGVPSGSYFTQLIDSVVSFIVAQYCCLRANINPSLVLVLGDDSLVSTSVEVNPKDYTDYAAELGIQINMDKTIWNSTEDVHFLGHTLSNNGTLTRPSVETVLRLVFTESRKAFTFEESIARCVGHFIDSGNVAALNLAHTIRARAYYRRDKWQEGEDPMRGFDKVSRGAFNFKACIPVRYKSCLLLNH